MDSCYDFSEDSEMSAKIEATIEDLYRVPENGKAEIIDGELVLMPQLETCRRAPDSR